MQRIILIFLSWLHAIVWAGVECILKGLLVAVGD